MRFKAPKAGVELRVTTLEGHICMLGDDWTELPEVLHEAAIKAGAAVDQTIVQATPLEPQASPDAIDQRTDIQKIVDAIRELQKKNDPEDFTSDGVPKIYPVSSIVGVRVDKADLLIAWAQVQAEK